jgi:hypothetical protein
MRFGDMDGLDMVENRRSLSVSLEVLGGLTEEMLAEKKFAVVEQGLSERPNAKRFVAFK